MIHCISSHLVSLVNNKRRIYVCAQLGILVRVKMRNKQVCFSIPLTGSLWALSCLVEGEATSNTFPVSTTNTATIGELKDLIKAKNTNNFQDVDANKLTLWRVSNPIVPANKHK